MPVELADILNYDLKAIPFEGWYSIEHVMEALDVSYYDINTEKIDKSLFLIKEIYDNPHESDEQSYRNLLFFRNKFCCIFGKSGDRGGIIVEFASNEIANELRFYLLSLEEKTYSIINENEIDLSDDYTFFFEKDGVFYYMIKKPKCSYCFGKDTDLHYIRDKSGNDLVKCKFISFKNDKRNWEEDEDDKFMNIKLETGEKIQAKYHRIVFSVNRHI